MNRQFRDINEGFTCIHCGTSVLPSTKSCRNHCPACFTSLHVDIHPGDRANDCCGVMEPIGVIAHSNKGYQVVHRCQRCGTEARNVLRFEDDVQPDSFERALALMAHPK